MARYGYPILAAATVACDEVRKYLEGENGSKVRYKGERLISTAIPDGPTDWTAPDDCQLTRLLALKQIDHVLFCVFRQLDVNACRPFRPPIYLSGHRGLTTKSRIFARADLEVVPAYFPPPPGTASANVVSEDGSDDMEGQEDTGAAAGEANEGQGQEAEGGEPVDGESEAEAKMEESGVP